MKHYRVVVTLAGTFLLLLAGPYIAESQNLIKNGDFEQFVGDDPVGWETSNIPKFCTVVTPSSQAASGNRAAKLEVRDCSGAKIPGMITMRRIPIKELSYAMQLKYLLHSVGKDMGFISMEFHNAQGNTIRLCQENLTAASGQFQAFSGSFPAPKDATVAELKIAIIPEKTDGDLHPGTYLLVDALSMKEVPVEKVQ